MSGQNSPEKKKRKFSLPDVSLVNVKKSEKETDAVHFGDLNVGWDTTRINMSGGRSTGHFGTGVYFVSKDVADKTLANKDHRLNIHGKRPYHYMDLSGLNLYKATTSNRAYTLHEFLKTISWLVHTGNWPDPQARFNYRHPDNRLWHNLAMDIITLGFSFDIDKTLAIIKIELIREKKMPKSEIRSISTRVMLRLGYQGIDVRHTDMDNFQYGSVIYI